MVSWFIVFGPTALFVSVGRLKLGGEDKGSQDRCNNPNQ